MREARIIFKSPRIMLDTPPFRVYFYTRMMHEQMTLFTESTPSNVGGLQYQAYSGVGLSIHPSFQPDGTAFAGGNYHSGGAGVAPARELVGVVPTVHGSLGSALYGDESFNRLSRMGSARRCPSVQAVETLLRRTSVGAQLLVALTYDTGVPVSVLLNLRVRDVHFGRCSFRVGVREIKLAREIGEDLRNFIHDSMCGFEASTDVSGGQQFVFSKEAARELEAILADVQISPRDLRLAGRLHLYLARRKRSDAAWRRAHTTPLSLFEKGPMIVRRGAGGSIRAYYLWRGAGEV